MRVAFVHPDLGIGGAENLVINAAVALQSCGHEVTIFTAHCDRSHCFAEVKPGGSLGARVRVHGDWLPRRLPIIGGGTALCAVVRMLYVSLVVAIWHTWCPALGVSLRHLCGRGGGGCRAGGADVVFCDQVSACIPLLRWLAGAPVLFYCHYPDKLLCVEGRGRWAKRVYRAILDTLEEATTGCADSVLVNSAYTANVFACAFRRLHARGARPRILYPPVDVAAFAKGVADQGGASLPAHLRPGSSGGGDPALFLSINRFERKKGLVLAVDAFAAAKAALLAAPGLTALATPPSYGGGAHGGTAIHLVLAGGYDRNLRENVEHLAELRTRVRARGLVEGPGGDVTFLPSFSDRQKGDLLHRCRCVVYTPEREHFGIVPVEAMAAGRAVIAASSGGPLESIVDGTTGFLCNAEADAFARAMVRLVRNPGLAARMGRAGRARAAARFSLAAFAASLDAQVRALSAAAVSRRSEVGGSNAGSSWSQSCWPAFVAAAGVMALLTATIYPTML